MQKQKALNLAKTKRDFERQSEPSHDFVSRRFAPMRDNPLAWRELPLGIILFNYDELLLQKFELRHQLNVSHEVSPL